MEEEINLRKYLDVLLRQWKVIAGITAIAVIVAVLVSFLTPYVYEAKAGLLVVQSPAGTLSRQTLVAAVKSSAVTTQVIEQLGDKLKPEEQNPEIILGKVQVGGQDNLIEIYVRDTDPQTAAMIANAWAKPYESAVVDLYHDATLSAAKLEAQADAAKKDYEAKQQAMEDFTSSNRIEELNRWLSDKELLCNIKSLRGQIETGSSSSASAAADNLALLLLQSQSFAGLPSGLQISADALSNLKADLDDIDVLIKTLEARSGGVGYSISELRKEMLQLRGELEAERAKERELQQARDTAWQIYVDLARKVMNAEITALAQGATIQVTQDASVPQSPATPRRGVNIVIALVLGLVVGIFIAFVFEFFKKTGGKPEVKKDGA